MTKAGPANEVVSSRDGLRMKRMGVSNLVVSEFGIGTQRWGSADFNGPDEALCHAMLDRAVSSRWLPSEATVKLQPAAAEPQYLLTCTTGHSAEMQAAAFGMSGGRLSLLHEPDNLALVGGEPRSAEGSRRR